jgi:hypothetical protein
MIKTLALGLAVLLSTVGIVHAYDFTITGYVDGELQAVQAGDEWSNSFGDASEVLLWVGTDPAEEVSLVSEVSYRQATNDISVWQAMVNWMAYGEEFQVRAGKFWFPYGIERRYLYSTTNPLVSRPFETRSGLGVAPAALARSWQDHGAGIHGMLDLGQSEMNLSYDLAVSNGLSGTTIATTAPDNNDNKTFGGMVALMPVEGVEVGGSFALGKYDAPGENSFMLAGGHAVYSMIEGLDVMGEFRYGSIDAAGPAGADLTSMLFYGTASYRAMVEGIEYFQPAVRFGWADPDTDTDGDTFMQVAAGITVSPVEHLSFKGEFLLNQEDDAVKIDNNEVLFQAVLGW